MEQLQEYSAQIEERNAPPRKLRIAFLASHNGTDMQAIIQAIHVGQLNAEPVLMISNNSDARAIEYVNTESPIQFKTAHISNKSGDIKKTDQEVDYLIQQALLESQADVVVLCGYMKKVGQQTLRSFEGRILNVHPALLPDLQGHWGDAIYKEVLRRKKYQSANLEVHWTGVTIHEVDQNYDTGRHIRQAGVKIRDDDTVATLKARVQSLEKTMYIQVLQDFASGILEIGKEAAASRR